jgi:hypothetical protein
MTALATACSDQPTALGDTEDGVISLSEASAASSHGGGATVHNPGEGQPNGFCYFGPFTAAQVSAVRTPSGNGTLSCKFEDLPPVPKSQTIKGFRCSLSLNGYSITTDSKFTRTPSGNGQMTCQFKP